jgi:exodeoxyribonuclease VII small subunit
MPPATSKRSPSEPEIPSDPADLDYAGALAQLEQLVREMESDRIPLEDLVHRYEQGTQLYKICEQRLEEAQGRIEIIRKKRNGDTVVESFDPTASDGPTETDSPSAKGDQKTHGELF